MKLLNRALESVRIKYFPTDSDKTIRRWLVDNGDYYYRLEYDLDETSLVIDLGAYKGQFTSDLFSKYRCNMLVFEPISEFYEFIRDRFKKNPKIQTFNFALGDQDKTELFFLDSNGTSIINKYGRAESLKQQVVFQDIDTFFKEKKITSVDLIKINIEGGEYDLLQYILEKDMAKIFRNIQVQFHNYIPDSEKKMASIQAKLQKTHNISWQYRFVWENWVRK